MVRCENKEDTADWGWVYQWKEKCHSLSQCSHACLFSPRPELTERTGSDMRTGSWEMGEEQLLKSVTKKLWERQCPDIFNKVLEYYIRGCLGKRKVKYESMENIKIISLFK